MMPSKPLERSMYTRVSVFCCCPQGTVQVKNGPCSCTCYQKHHLLSQWLRSCCLFVIISIKDIFDNQLRSEVVLSLSLSLSLSLTCTHAHTHTHHAHASIIFFWSTYNLVFISFFFHFICSCSFVDVVIVLTKIQQMLQLIWQGLYRKIHSKFTNFSQTFAIWGKKSNTKVCNSAAHLVKGHNPYCGRRLMHFISQNWLEVNSLWFCTAIFLDNFFFNDCWVLGSAVSDW